MKKDEEHVKRVASGLKMWVLDMWKMDLVNISDGTVASEEMLNNVLNARKAGEDALIEFLRRFTEGNNHRQSELKYNDPIKKQKVHTFTNQKRKSRKKQQTIPEDECESLGNILAQFDEKKLDLRHLLHWPVTSKPWAICSEANKKRSTGKSLFRNNLQLLSPISSMTTVPPDISCSVVDEMRVVRMIPISNLPSMTFLGWAKRLLNYIKHLPGKKIHIVFDVYDEEESHNSLSKRREIKSRERKIEDLSQKLPNVNEWADFLTNSKNKCRLTWLLADFF